MQNLPEWIAPAQIADKALEYRVFHPSNPNNCPCGWYVFYSGTCRHVFQQHPFKCGGKTTPSLRSGFCSRPAPQNIVRNCLVYGNCPQCPQQQ
ncbi:hypothetical protein F4781DRAFT_389485 [Annulohypoxylon bovei var. microspora]|nr:hypothetical protein F4781DRAFT_389485 [Annulohypoxylon bovei var. microspora]